MPKDKQYKEDSARLAVLIEKYTNIPQDKVYQFVMENTANNLLPYANKLCKTTAQREKLNALFEFKNLYEIVKSAEKKEYVLDSQEASMEYFKNYFADKKDKEYFAVTYLDVAFKVIKTNTISEGSVATTHVYPREIFKEALFLNASTIMLSHNHPSGCLRLSAPDIEMTKLINKGIKSIGLQLCDHIIVGGDSAVSVMDSGFIPDMKRESRFSKDANTVSEYIRNRQPVKPLGIKQQLALAQRQLSSEQKTPALRKEKSDRGER